MLDAVLALTVLIIGIVIIASSFISRPQPSQVDILSTDLLKFMSEKKIKPASTSLILSTLKFFYKEVLEKDIFAKIKTPKLEKKIPTVFILIY